MVKIPAAIEHHPRDALGFGALGNCLADQFRAFQVAAFAAHVILETLFRRRSGYQCMPLLIVDHLRVNVIQTAKDSQPRTLLRSRHATANPFVDAQTNFVLTGLSHYLPPAPVLPAFLRNTSPV